MKKLLFFGSVLAVFWSYNVNDSVDDKFRFEIFPIKTVEILKSFSYNEFYAINYTYIRLSTCNIYNDLYYISKRNFRTIAVINTLVNAIKTSQQGLLTKKDSFAFHVQKNTRIFVLNFGKEKLIMNKGLI